MPGYLKTVKTYLQHPVQLEQQAVAISTSLLATVGGFIMLLVMPGLSLPVRISSLALVFNVAAVLVCQKRYARLMQTEWQMFPYSVSGLFLLAAVIMATGKSHSPFFLVYFVAVIATGQAYRPPLARAHAVLCVILMGLPLMGDYDPKYLQIYALSVPILLGVGHFMGVSMAPLRAHARQNRYLETLARTTEILAKQDLDAILDETVRQVIETTGADTGILFLLDADGTLIPRVVRVNSRLFTEERVTLLKNARIRVGQGMTGWVAREQKPLLSGDSERDPRAYHVPGTPVEDASCIFVPMVTGEKTIGVIRASRQGLNQFTEEDLHLLQVLAGQAAISVKQAQLFAETRTLALTDPLTGLHNRRYFNHELQPSLTRDQGATRLAVLMMDIYDFKRINDTFGHETGDEALRAIARVLRSAVRSGDEVIRYGGDEFVVIMLDADLAQANRVKQAIETAIDRWNRTERPATLPELTLNIGVEAASASDVQQLLARADQDMYAAKRSEERRRLTRLLEESENTREKHTLQAVLALTKIQELKDPYTRGHSERARRMAMRVAERLGLSHEDVITVGFGAVLHDVGKIVIPPEILHKAGPLNDEEKRVMRLHPEYGANIVGELDLLSDIRPLVLYHQERYDGETSGNYPGYPEGRAGSEIPIGARIIAVVDSYDAMTSNRSYRNALPPDQAVAELRRHAGSQFDPQVVKAFLDVLQEMGDD